ncbi:MAG: PadR family transcriptional regulator, partial [Bacillota bacterium]|nr:PadR family transcriptional regulator [Bacillota bacterium]
MSLKHALLGFLNYQSMTGYQLKKHFDESVSNFWSVSLSQIYPTLNQMSEQGLLTVEVIQQDTAPNAKVYQITDSGKEELLKWLAEP